MKTVLQSRNELLFLSGCKTCLSDWSYAGSQWFFPFSKKKLWKWLTYVKYVLMAVFVVIMPVKKTCVSCGKCHNICPMDVDPVKNSKSVECIRCGKCVASCPKESLALKFVYGKRDSFINVFRK